MRQSGFILFCLLFFFGVSLAGGCISIPTTPQPRFYTLEALDRDQPVKTYDIEGKMVICIGPVKVPEFLNRPQMVTVNKKKLLEFSEFDRWGESLDFAFGRVMNENLALMMPKVTIEMYPWNLNIPIRYQVIVSIITLECDLNQDMFLLAQWTVIDHRVKKAIFTKRSALRQAIVPHNYFGLSKALSTACASLSEEIASELSLLAPVR